MIPIDLKDKVALVTGSSRGIGAAIAKRLAGAGARVAIHHRDNKERACRLGKEVDAAMVLIDGADLRDQQQTSSMIDSVCSHLGPIDILVNNAGLMENRSLAKMVQTDWESVIATNLSGTFHVTRAALGRIRGGGRIINLASIAAVVGFHGQTSYAASKAGIMGMTRVWARELAPHGILVNAVAPGVVLTDMGRQIPPSALNSIRETIPLQRFAEPEEVADVVLFLASPLARYVTGQTIHVNGGAYC